MMIIAITMTKARGDMTNRNIIERDDINGLHYDDTFTLLCDIINNLYGRILVLENQHKGVETFNGKPLFGQCHNPTISCETSTYLRNLDGRIRNIESEMSGVMNGEMNDQNGSMSRTTKEGSD